MHPLMNPQGVQIYPFKGVTGIVDFLILLMEVHSKAGAIATAV